MSKINYVDIMFHERKTCLDFVELLLENGWQYEREGKMTLYLEIEDDHEWIDMPADREKLIDHIESWKDENKICGVILYYKDTDIGGDLLIHKGKTISFMADINTIYNEDLEGMKIIKAD